MNIILKILCILCPRSSTRKNGNCSNFFLVGFPETTQITGWNVNKEIIYLEVEEDSSTGWIADVFTWEAGWLLSSDQDFFWIYSDSFKWFKRFKRFERFVSFKRNWGESVREQIPAHNPNKQTNKQLNPTDPSSNFDKIKIKVFWNFFRVDLAANYINGFYIVLSDRKCKNFQFLWI